MFSRTTLASRERVSKAVRTRKRSFREQSKLNLRKTVDKPVSCDLTSPIITLVVGPTRRLFACHLDLLAAVPFFAPSLQDAIREGSWQRLELPREEPEIFSAVLEYLYKGDYTPHLVYDRKRRVWELDSVLEVASSPGPVAAAAAAATSPTLNHLEAGGVLLKDTAVYCAAEQFGLDELKRLALRKQGLRSGIQVDVIIRSARFAYTHTSDQDAKLRAHFLALIIRSRQIFKRSGTLQKEMEAGGSQLFFDLFVAMCNHIDDVVDLAASGSPRSV